MTLEFGLIKAQRGGPSSDRRRHLLGCPFYLKKCEDDLDADSSLDDAR
jgi:hypothetical protein